MTKVEQASKLISEIALELHRDGIGRKKPLINECIERAAFGVLFALEVCHRDAIRTLGDRQ